MDKNEFKKHLTKDIIPFWKSLRDDEYGGYYGYVSRDLVTDKKACKGCILNSRITWFFANAYTLLGDESLLSEARHGFDFMKAHCLDREKGGVFWSVAYDGQALDTTKHTYNQAFSIYALSSYYVASKDEEALSLAKQLFELIEDKCRDEIGYLEAFNRDFEPEENDKLSENGVMAEKTMNTLLHVFEAYTELYRVSGDERVRARIEWILDTIADKVYDPKLHRQEVFFDKEMNSIINLHSYGHDIETAWLVDRGLEILKDKRLDEKLHPITEDLTQQVYRLAFNGESTANECDRGVVDEKRIWWVQAEAVIGFYNGYQRRPSEKDYLLAAEKEWRFIMEHLRDDRSGEWFWAVDVKGEPLKDLPIVEPWKCPYHNGRMCIEMIRRLG